MIVEAYGGRHDGRTLEVRDGTTALSLPLFREMTRVEDSGAPAYVEITYPIERHPIYPERFVIDHPIYWIVDGHTTARGRS